ncbi:hypothetical protein CXG81DRAFT_19586 [Caulochytrium protostelioides]|uniref:C3H1-type domain-containing protein n=1 Tax=Caulochytrium protostelioides TaxID=1555241 RepID=A0A4P9X5Q2_9FUNG|nr:hypothetical protein CXG81DRAFT_19586 [Caulochytrium protostelioides]|eukprot:RKP00475.1 hypothetical protein CXG81DRAFT_19586 [Caulochytrium protostelioides]
MASEFATAFSALLSKTGHMPEEGTVDTVALGEYVLELAKMQANPAQIAQEIAESTSSTMTLHGPSSTIVNVFETRLHHLLTSLRITHRSFAPASASVSASAAASASASASFFASFFASFLAFAFAFASSYSSSCLSMHPVTGPVPGLVSWLRMNLPRASPPASNPPAADPINPDPVASTAPAVATTSAPSATMPDVYQHSTVPSNRPSGTHPLPSYHPNTSQHLQSQYDSSSSNQGSNTRYPRGRGAPAASRGGSQRHDPYARPMSSGARRQPGQCYAYPNCPRGDNCPYSHDISNAGAPSAMVPASATAPAPAPVSVPINTWPPCRFGLSCRNAYCKFSHAPGALAPASTASTSASALPSSAAAPSSIAVTAAVPAYASADTRSSIPCRFYPNCRNITCPFRHGAGSSPAAAASAASVPATTTATATTAGGADGDLVMATAPDAALAGLAQRSPMPAAPMGTRSSVPCHFQAACTRPQCPFVHFGPRAAINGAAAPAKQHISERAFVVAGDETEQIIPGSGL